MVRALATPQCRPGVSRRRRHTWVELVVGSLLCSERFFCGYSAVFPPFQKQIPPNSNSIRNARTRFNEFLRTPKCFVVKK